MCVTYRKNRLKLVLLRRKTDKIGGKGSDNF